MMFGQKQSCGGRAADNLGRIGMLRRCLSWIVASVALVAGTARSAEPPRVVMISGSAEYKSDESLPPFQEYLQQERKIESVLLKATAVDNLPGTEALENADVVVFFTRRLTIDGEPLARIKRYCEAGKPIVGIRTASHGFQNWLEFDKLYLGGNYLGHYGNNSETTASIVPEAQNHPLLRGVIGPLTSKYSLYKTAPLAPGCIALMTGTTPEASETQPVTWAREIKGQRIFYTSLGGVDDMQQPAVRKLLLNALLWTTGRETTSE